MGIISPVLLPDYVALLPELTTSMPASIAASTGIDALCHLLECFTSTVANPVSDNAALIGLHKLVRHIERSVDQPQGSDGEAGDALGLVVRRRGDQPCRHPSGACALLSAWRYRHLPQGWLTPSLLAPCMRVVRPHAVAKFRSGLGSDPRRRSRTLSEEERNPMRWSRGWRRW
ncbi:iron-containing alcohol dehydrogenase [Klebsiella variicola subsp. variicola]|nr:iron-containing alcohol dehydrogenase [Klebsiella variicola subsp. variicola]